MTAIQEKKGRNYPILLVIGGILVLILITFALQNAENVEMRFFKLHGEIAKSLLIFSCIFGGVLVGIIFSLPSLFKWRRRAKSAEKELSNKTKEIDARSKPEANDSAEKIKKPST